MLKYDSRAQHTSRAVTVWSTACQAACPQDSCELPRLLAGTQQGNCIRTQQGIRPAYQPSQGKPRSHNHAMHTFFSQACRPQQPLRTCADSHYLQAADTRTRQSLVEHAFHHLRSTPRTPSLAQLTTIQYPCMHLQLSRHLATHCLNTPAHIPHLATTRRSTYLRCATPSPPHHRLPAPDHTAHHTWTRSLLLTCYPQATPLQGIARNPYNKTQEPGPGPRSGVTRCCCCCCFQLLSRWPRGRF